MNRETEICGMPESDAIVGVVVLRYLPVGIKMCLARANVTWKCRRGITAAAVIIQHLAPGLVGHADGSNLHLGRNV